MRLWIGIFIFVSVGCSTLAKKDYRYIAIPDVINDDPLKQLSDSQVRSDVDQVLYALTTTYSGRKFLPNQEFPNLISDIQSIKGPMTAEVLCQHIDTAFEKVSDSHLNAKFKNKNCVPNGHDRKGQVGKNFFPRGDIPWLVKTEKRKNKTALLVSITSFPSSSSPVWNGFIDSVKKELPKKDLVILDMRGNGGGDDTKGYELSTLLAGRKLPTPYKPQWTGNNPEVFQIFINSFEYWSRLDRDSGKTPPEYLSKLKNEFTTKRDRASRGENVPFHDTSVQNERRPDAVAEPIAKTIPIYILMDADCGSSCESTINSFELNPNTRLVGENTAGYVHFGNNGSVFLNNSGVMLQFAASYNSYIDGRFIEKTGISPQIKAAPSSDALDVAWKDYFKKR